MDTPRSRDKKKYKKNKFHDRPIRIVYDEKLVPLGIIYVVRTRNFPKNYYFLPLDTYVCVSGGKKS